MNRAQTILPNWVPWPSRIIFILFLAYVTQQMLTSTPAAVFVPIWDKLLHFGAWSLIVSLGYCATRGYRSFTQLTLAIFIYSLLLELLQLFVAQRSFSIGDILGNLLGCLSAYWLTPTIDRYFSRFCR